MATPEFSAAAKQAFKDFQKHIDALTEDGRVRLVDGRTALILPLKQWAKVVQFPEQKTFDVVWFYQIIDNGNGLLSAKFRGWVNFARLFQGKNPIRYLWKSRVSDWMDRPFFDTTALAWSKRKQWNDITLDRMMSMDGRVTKIAWGWERKSCVVIKEDQPVELVYEGGDRRFHFYNNPGRKSVATMTDAIRFLTNHKYKTQIIPLEGQAAESILSRVRTAERRERIVNRKAGGDDNNGES